MSRGKWWKRKRENRKRRWFNRTEMTRHHAPPRSRRNPWYGVVIPKTENQHVAFHILFGAPKDIEECVEILRRDWWPSEK